jgi:hypothetical protein
MEFLAGADVLFFVRYRVPLFSGLLSI